MNTKEEKILIEPMKMELNAWCIYRENGIEVKLKMIGNELFFQRPLRLLEKKYLRENIMKKNQRFSQS
ncbi:hypothetical protein BD809_10993 [Aquimarina intermedia]|uniref:Uncharacterized protein n=1 Tax=Aquimarina intermedia TaxID=350814 RepID=A0A5S5BWE5_9FLAO|nr:hypothetical protein BD809_10993 [Aquimarina intermedia]